jgi:hypothetical protein
LINTLKDLIDGLYSLVSLRSDLQNEAIKVDITELIDLSELHIVEEACQASSYPAWSAAANLAIDRTESGTIDRPTDYKIMIEETQYTREVQTEICVGQKPLCSVCGYVYGDPNRHSEGPGLPVGLPGR